MNNYKQLNKDIIYYLSSKNKITFDVDKLNQYKSYIAKNDLLDFFKIKINDIDYLKHISYMEREVKKIIDLFNVIENETGICYFTMKSFLTFPYFDHDIDFIVTKSGYNVYKKALIKHGFKVKYDLSNIREPLKMLFSSDKFFITPHLHSEISWNGIIAASKDDVYENRLVKNYDTYDIKTPSNTDEVNIAICHFIFENYYIKLGELIYLRDLLDTEIDYEKIERTSEKYGYRKGVYLYFSYINALSSSLGLKIKVNPKYIHEVEINAEKPFPYYIPYKKLIPVYIENFKNGIKRKQYINLFRKLFTYTLVGYLWKYWLSIKRQKKFLSQFQD